MSGDTSNKVLDVSSLPQDFGRYTTGVVMTASVDADRSWIYMLMDVPLVG